MKNLKKLAATVAVLLVFAFSAAMELGAYLWRVVIGTHGLRGVARYDDAFFTGVCLGGVIDLVLKVLPSPLDIIGNALLLLVLFSFLSASVRRFADRLRQMRG